MQIIAKTADLWYLRPMKFFAAAIQMTAWSDKQANLEKACELIRQAAAKGATFVTLPEVFSWRGPKEMQFEASESIPGPTSERLSDLAQELGIYILAGSIVERSTDTHAYNTSMLFDNQGSLVGRYRKIHLFDVDMPGHISIKESASKHPGEEVVACQTELGVIGLSICYDVRFPELYRHLVDKGATILTIPAAFTVPSGAAHWEALLRARAIENQCYVIAPNQVGKNVYGYEDYGHSMIIDPWGKILAEGSETKEDLVLAEIDSDYQEKVRQQLPCLTHRRVERELH